MYQHLIITYSTYKQRTRVAYHECYKELKEGRGFLVELEKLKKQFANQSFGFYHTVTEECTWQSVVDYDEFFSDVENVISMKKFKDIILEDTDLSPKEIAKAILARKKISHLSLQKLIYFLWIEHKKNTKDDLIKGHDFEAWDHGPVINDLYHEYSRYGRNTIDLKMDDEERSIFQSRLMKYPYYEQLLESIETTLDEYGDRPAYWLRNKTHEFGSPWCKVYKTSKNQIIPKELIEEYYINQNY